MLATQGGSSSFAFFCACVGASLRLESLLSISLPNILFFLIQQPIPPSSPQLFYRFPPSPRFALQMAPPPSNEAKNREAKKLAKTDPAKAETIFKEVLAKSPGSNQAALQDYENALVGLGELYRDNKRLEDLAELVKTSRSTLSSFAKAKTAKLGMFIKAPALAFLTDPVFSPATPRLLHGDSQLA